MLGYQEEGMWLVANESQVSCAGVGGRDSSAWLPQAGYLPHVWWLKIPANYFLCSVLSLSCPSNSMFIGTSVWVPALASFLVVVEAAPWRRGLFYPRFPGQEVRAVLRQHADELLTQWPSSISQDLLLSLAPSPRASVSSQSITASLRPGVQSCGPVGDVPHSEHNGSFCSKSLSLQDSPGSSHSLWNIP